MGYLDRLLGKQEQAEEQAAPAPELPSTSSPTPEALVRDFSPMVDVRPSSSMYNPYDGISDALGGKKAVFALPEGPEFVFADDAAVKRRGWSEHLYFYTGTGYVAGGRRGDGCAL